METAIVSDTHGYLPKIETQFPTELFIHCGDLCPATNHNCEFQANFVNDKFIPWINSIPAKNKVFIAGNHDFVFEEYPSLINWDLLDDSVTYLRDSFVIVNGLKVYGTPWVPKFGNWAFMKLDEDLVRIYDNIPDDIDILVTHGPSYSVLDCNTNGKHCGSKSLFNRVQELNKLGKIKLHTSGHIHEARGIISFEEKYVINAASVDEDYQLRKEYITSLLLS